MSDLVLLGRRLFDAQRKVAARVEPDRALDELIHPTPTIELQIAEVNFLYKLIFSNVTEIESILELFYGEFFDLPIWMRHLTFRLACLQQPENAEIRRRAARDLRIFGPDWDDIAAKLDLEADEIEKNSPT